MREDDCEDVSEIRAGRNEGTSERVGIVALSYKLAPLSESWLAPVEIAGDAALHRFTYCALMLLVPKLSLEMKQRGPHKCFTCAWIWCKEGRKQQ